MSTKSSKEATSNADKILNSDIYDLTEFVDDVKKVNIDGTRDDITNGKDTLISGIYGYLGYQFTSILQNAIVTSSEMANEAIPTRAKFDRNVITHALRLGINKINATPATMKVIILFPEKALRNNMIDGEFTLSADTAIRFGDIEFHPDYDIIINYSKLDNSTNGTMYDYVYTARYNMSVINPVSEIDNEYLPPVAIYPYEDDNMIAISTVLHQTEYQEISEKIVGSDSITNKTLNFSFEGQMSHFTVEVTEKSEDTNKTVELVPVYDGLYNQEQDLYVYYQYINMNTIRLRFDPNKYQPRTNADVIIKVWTTQGYSGNFEFHDQLTVRLTSDKYTNMYMNVIQANDGSYGGLDRKSVEEIQRIIPKDSLSRGSITTGTDLINYFNSINNEDSVVHVFKKEDNILRRIYYAYSLMKDSDGNVVPTNTIPIFINSSSPKGKIYLESGTPIYFFKNRNIEFSFMRNKFVGYLAGPSNSADINKIMTGDNINFDYFQITEFDEETIDSITYKETEDSVTIRKFSSEAAGKYYRYENGVVTPNVGFVAINEGDKYEEDVTYYSKITNVNGEVLSISYKSGKAQSLTVLIDKRIGEYYKEVINAYQMTNVKSYPDFIYNCPMSIVVVDENSSQSHKASTKYYLDIINENRYLSFKCINGLSPIQFIITYVNVKRPSYLDNKNRYKYTITASLSPNIGTISDEMANRIQLVYVYYKNGIPICYAISDGKDVSLDESNECIIIKTHLYTKSFNTYDDQEVIDDNGCIYIGDESYPDEYDIYEVGLANEESNFRRRLSTVYLDTNTTMRIYVFYRYDGMSDKDVQSKYTDDRTAAYLYKGTYDAGTAISDIVPISTLFNTSNDETSNIPFPDIYNDNDRLSPYKLSEMVLCNVYETQDGINLLYDYSDLMNSEVSYYRPSTSPDIVSRNYIINRVPVIRHFYFYNDERINTFIKEMKRKTVYVIDAIDPLETTFGIDFKFFNTFGPSNMYRTTDKYGNISGLIENVSLKLRFRTKFYNEDSDKNTIVPLIVNDIKEYIEKLDSLDDIHFPNITTMIENNYSEYIIYFEFLNCNSDIDATNQHIITDENLEMLKVVPEFLNIDTDDYTSAADIEIEVVS